MALKLNEIKLAYSSIIITLLISCVKIVGMFFLEFEFILFLSGT